MNAMMQMRRFGHQMHMMGMHATHSERLLKFEKLLASERFWVIFAVTMLLIGIVWLMLWFVGQGAGSEVDPFDSIFYSPYGSPFGPLSGP